MDFDDLVPDPVLSEEVNAVVTAVNGAPTNIGLESVARNSAGRRVYSERDLTWLTLLSRLRATGMPIATVKIYAQLVRDGSGNESERLELLRVHRETVLAQLAAMASNLGAIDYKIGVYEELLAAADEVAS